MVLPSRDLIQIRGSISSITTAIERLKPSTLSFLNYNVSYEARPSAKNPSIIG